MCSFIHIIYSYSYLCIQRVYTWGFFVLITIKGYLTLHNSKIYICKRSLLTVPPDDSLMCKPEFTKPLHDLSIHDGESLVLTCHVTGDPEPQITWSKNGKSISSSEIMDLRYKNGVATLTIHEVFPEDEGVFSCIATNSISAIETKCKLTVKRKCT